MLIQLVQNVFVILHLWNYLFIEFCTIYISHTGQDWKYMKFLGFSFLSEKPTLHIAYIELWSAATRVKKQEQNKNKPSSNRIVVAKLFWMLRPAPIMKSRDKRLKPHNALIL